MKYDNPLVSIVVPIYKVEKYLRKCIESIQEQTYTNIEIILVDDGSSDKCPSICDEMGKKDSRIIVLHKEHGGVSSARNEGIEAVRGEYLVFVDPDDYIHKRYVEILLKLCMENHADIAQCDFLAIDQDSKAIPLNFQEDYICTGMDALHRLCCDNDTIQYEVPWSKLYKKELFSDIRYPVNRIHEDAFTTYKLFWKAKKVVVTSLYLYYYMKRSDSIMGREYSLKRLDAIDAIKERLSFLKKHKLQEESIATLKNLYYLMDYACSMLQDNIENYGIVTNLQKEKENVYLELSTYKNCFIQQKEVYVLSCEKKLSGKRCLIYGAGEVGKEGILWLKSQYAEIVAVVDNRWYEKKNFQIRVKPIDRICVYDYDFIFIAIKNDNIREKIRENLLIWGVPQHKILDVRIVIENGS